MTGIVGGARVLRGDVGRKLNNALTMTFSTGGDEPVARCVQAARGGVVGKMGVLFGFKNGGSGFHEVIGTDGTILVIESREFRSTIVRWRRRHARRGAAPARRRDGAHRP